MKLHYVILHHTGVDQPHFDLMFETSPGSPLATWRSPAWPILAPTPVERLPDHRRAYLDYQGPVSRGRGRVRQVAAGTCHLDQDGDDHWRLSTPFGRLAFHRQAGADWIIEVPPAE